MMMFSYTAHNFALLTKQRLEQSMTALIQALGTHYGDTQTHIFDNTLINDCIKKLLSPEMATSKEEPQKPATAADSKDVKSQPVSSSAGATVSGSTDFLTALLTDPILIFKYAAQFNRIAGIVAHNSSFKQFKSLTKPNGTVVEIIEINNTPKYLEGWNQTDFLAMHLRFLVELYLRIHNDLVATASLPVKDKVILENAIKKEIGLTVNALSLYHTYSTLPTDTEKEKNTAIFIAQFLNALKTLFSDMQEGDELIFPCGTKKHALYLSFIRFRETLLLRLDNLGQGIEKIKGFSTDSKVKPYIVAQIAIGELTTHKNLLHYLTDVCLYSNKPAEAGGLDVLYNFSDTSCAAKQRILLPLPSDEKIGYPALEKQTIGNCVVENFEVGMRYRLHELGSTQANTVFEWLVRETIQVGFNDQKSGDDNIFSYMNAARRKEEMTRQQALQTDQKHSTSHLQESVLISLIKDGYFTKSIAWDELQKTVNQQWQQNRAALNQLQRQQTEARLYLYADPSTEELLKEEIDLQQLQTLKDFTQHVKTQVQAARTSAVSAFADVLIASLVQQQQQLQIACQGKQALLCYKQRSYPEAQSLLNKTLTLINTIPLTAIETLNVTQLQISIYNLQAKIARSEGNYSVAYQAYQAAIALNAKDGVLLSSMGALLNDRAKYENKPECHLEAIKYHRLAEKLLPKEQPIRQSIIATNLARGLQQLVESKQYDKLQEKSTTENLLKEADRHLTQALVWNSKNLTAYLFRGITRMDQNRLSEASVDIEQVLKLQSNHPTALRRKALILEQQDQYSTAKDFLDQARAVLQARDFIPEYNVWLQEITQQSERLEKKLIELTQQAQPTRGGNMHGSQIASNKQEDNKPIAPTKPEFKINSDAPKKKVENITHAEIHKIISETIINFEKTAKSFNDDVNDELTTPETLTSYLDKIKNLLSAARTEILQKGGDHTSVQRANDVLHYLEKQYTEVTNQLKLPTVISQTSTPSDSKSSYWQENRLRLEQQLLLNPSTTLAQRFSSTLELIRKQGHSDLLLPNGVFICYAWPDQKDEAQKHLSWVQPFLLGLRQHLQAAGIANAKLDIRDNPPGGNIYDYMRFAETADFVLLIGTESLLKKHQIGTSAVCTELININRKREKDVKANKYRVFPIMISGDYRESFPAHYELYTTVKDWKGTKTYFQHFQWLVAALYSTNENAFIETWKKFLDKSEEQEQLILTTGLNEQSVLDKLKAETKETEQKKNQQALASRQMLNLAPAMNDSKHTPAAIASASAATATSAPIGTTSNFFQAADTKKELASQTQAPASTTTTPVGNFHVSGGHIGSLLFVAPPAAGQGATISGGDITQMTSVITGSEAAALAAISKAHTK